MIQTSIPVSLRWLWQYLPLAMVGVAVAIIGYLSKSEPIIIRAALVLAAICAAAIFLKPYTVLVLIVVSVPFSGFDIFSLEKLSPQLAEVPFTISHVLGLVLFLSFLLRFLSRRSPYRSPKLLMTSVTLLIVAYGVSGLQTLGDSEHAVEFLKSFAYVALFGGYSIIAARVIRTGEQHNRLLRIWVLTALAIALSGIYQLVSEYIRWLPTLPTTGPVHFTRGVLRVMSILPEPTVLATFLSAPIGFMIVSGIHRLSVPFKRRMANLLTAIALGTAALLTGSPLAILTVGVSALALVILRTFVTRVGIKPGRILVVMVVLGGILLSPIGTPTLHRFVISINLGGGSTVDRANQFSVAGKTFLESPVVGVGAGNYQFIEAEGALASRAFAPKGNFGSSIFINHLAELGLVGVAAVVLFFGVLYIPILRLVRKASLAPEFHSIGLALIVALTLDTLTGFLIANGEGWYAFRPWTLYAMVAAWPLIARSERTAEAPHQPNAVATSQAGRAKSRSGVIQNG